MPEDNEEDLEYLTWQLETEWTARKQQELCINQLTTGEL